MEAAVETALEEVRKTVANASEAMVGTEVHAWNSQAIQYWLGGMEWGDAISKACNEAQAAGLDSWSVRCVQLCCEFARDLIASHGIERENVLTEHALDMTEIFGFTKSGTADLVLVVPFRKVIVVDWKAGFLDQGDADDHDQLSIYGIAAAATFKAEEVLVYLYQPRTEKKHRASAATFSGHALAANRAWIAAVVRRARADHPELSPSFDACKFCKALTRCAAAKEWIMHATEAAALIGNPNDPDAWGELCAVAKTAEKFAESSIEEAKAYAKAGGAITEWALKDSGTMTKIDAPKAIALAREAGAIDQLLEFASFKAGAAEAVPAIAGAVSQMAKSPSLKQVKGARGAA